MAIKSEVSFGVDNFGKSKILTDVDTVATLLLRLFLLRPGQLPSQPHIGININKYLYKFADDIHVEQLRSEILEQAPYMMQYLDMPSMQMFVQQEDEQSILYIYAPMIVDRSKAIAFGFKKPKSTNIITFNYKVTDNVLS